MKKILISILVIIFPIIVFAAPRQQLDDGNGNIVGTAANPIHVNCVSGCGSGGGGNVGIGTANTVTWWGPLNTLQSSNNFTFNGINVGIGTINPTQQLEVNGNISLKGGQIGQVSELVSDNFDVTDLDNSLQYQGGYVSVDYKNRQLIAAGVGGVPLDWHTGNIGINSTSPVQALDVKGTARMTGFILTTSPSSGFVLTSNSSGIGTWAAASGGGSSQWTGTTGSTPVTLVGSNVGIGTSLPSQLLEVGARKFDITSTGSVGIGTINPRNTLEVNGNIRSDSNYIYATGTLMADSAGNLDTADLSYSSLIFSTADSCNVLDNQNQLFSNCVNADGLALIDSSADYNWGNNSGNSGKGVFADVIGNIHYGNSTDDVLADNFGDLNYSNGYGVLVDQSGETFYSNGYGRITDNGGDIYYSDSFGSIADSFGDLYYSNSFGLISDASGNLYYSDGFGRLTDNAGNLYYSNGIPLVDNGENLYYGNGAKLADNNAVLYYSNGNAMANTFPALLYPGGGTLSAAEDLYYGNLGTKMFDANTLQLFNPRHQVMSDISGNLYVSSPGNLGIGTTVPSNQVEVGARKLDIDINGNIGIGSNNPQNSIVVMTGNVGIGSASPGQKLDVSGTVRMTNFRLTTSPSSGFVLTSDASGNGTWQATGAIPVGANPTASIGLTAVNGSATTFMRSDAAPALGVTISPTMTGNWTFSPSSGNTLINAGNVGINSATPGQKLDVVGTVRMTGFTMATGASSGFVLTSNSAGVGTWQATSGGSSQWVGTAGSTITYAQNVGIGTTTASQQLAVGTTGQFNVSILGALNAPQAIFTSTSSSIAAVDAEGASTGIAIRGNVNGAGSIALILSGGGKNISETTTAQNDFAGNIGIGTTIYTNALVIKGSYVQQWGTNIPSLSSCGGGTPTVKGTDNDFQITVGTVATGCTASFGGTYSDASCIVSNQSMSITSALGYTVSASTIVISQGVGLSGDLLNVHCGFKN